MAYGYMRASDKMMQEIGGSQKMSGEQQSTFQSCGGAAGYQEMRSWPVEAQWVYKAIGEGLTDEASIEVATGLSKGDIAFGTSFLEDRGAIPKGTVTAGSGLEMV